MGRAERYTTRVSELLKAARARQEAEQEKLRLSHEKIAGLASTTAELTSASESFKDAIDELAVKFASFGSVGVYSAVHVHDPTLLSGAMLYEETASGLTAKVSGNVTPGQALDIILMDIKAEILNGDDAVMQKASYWLTRITNEITAITRHSDEE